MNHVYFHLARFLEIPKGLERPLAGIIAGAVFTAVVLSSAATVGITIAMASERLLALPAGIAPALGANIGTAVTTAIMGILSSKSTEGVRASVVHVAFNATEAGRRVVSEGRQT